MLVPAIVVRVVIHLERGVVLHRPHHLLAHVGPEDFRREAIVVLRGQPIANVVEEGGHHPVDVSALPVGPGRCLKPVLD